MTYFAKPNHIEYDNWFDSNINAFDLINYTNEKGFKASIHQKFYQLSVQNLTIGSSNNLH